VLILGFWLVGADAASQPALVLRPSLGIFLGGYVLLVLAVAAWARLLCRRLLTTDPQGALTRFHRIVRMARWMVPAWLLYGLFAGPAWGQLVLAITGTKYQVPGVLLGTLPSLLAWMALWWAEFPADRALREQSILGELFNDLPVHMPPPFVRYALTMLRQQLLPIILPVLLIILVRDVVLLAAGRFIGPGYDELVTLVAALALFPALPEVLRFLFNARPLEDSPLRRRLEAICRRTRLRYRDILLWQTEYSIANAAVIGVLPRWRYVLLSDRLIETMTDDQIEAVFAHEAGHIVHHHLLWFVLFFALLMLAAMGPGQIIDDWITARLPGAFREMRQYQTVHDVLSGAAVFVGMALFFGMLSRRFERQADVFAARMMENNWGDLADAAEPQSASASLPRRLAYARCLVGPRGAAILASALHRVAVVNNIPLRARDWLHPSIAKRMGYLEDLSADPPRTRDFDRLMSRLYAALVLAIVVCGVLALVAR